MARIIKPGFSFKGIHSKDMVVELIETPEIPKPARRGKPIPVPGRNGDLWLDEGVYDSIQFHLKCRSKNPGAQTLISAWLDGPGDLIFDADSRYAYHARATSDYKYTPQAAGCGNVLTVKIDAQPFRYESNPKPIQKDEPGNILNPGSIYAEPRITIYGSGDITLLVGGNTYMIAGVTEHIIIDSEAKIAYKKGATGMPNIPQNTRLSGGWPTLSLDYTPISWMGAVQYLIIEPNWRWL